jgi:hypothetical protein
MDHRDNSRFAIITPSYAPDFDHCQLLVESVQRHVPSHVKHYVIVDQKDMAQFSVLQSRRTELVLKQDILPWWVLQLKFLPKWWVSLRSLPVRGWIIQQLVKLSVNRALTEDNFIFLDSGAMFVRDYDPSLMLRDGLLPLYREQKEEVRISWNIRWHQVAARLLGLPVLETYDTNYVGNNPIYWKRSNLSKLQRQIEKVTGRHWAVAVCRQPRMSEYVIYGMFAEHVLKEQSGQYHTPEAHTLSYWEVRTLDEQGLNEHKRQLKADDFLVTFNEHARIPIEHIRRVFLENA